MKSRLIITALVLLCARGGWTQVDMDLSEMTGFRVPEYDKDGNKRSELTGDYAKMNEEGDVEVTNLRIEIYKDGKVDTLVTAPKCTYNQKKGVAYSRSRVKMARENMVLTGKGFAYTHTNEVFKIFSEARVVIKNTADRGQLLGEKP